MNYSKLLGLTAGLSLMAGVSAFAAFPKSADLVEKMGFGFNIGNSMEVPNDPTGWGNPFPTKDLMDSIKAAGFSTVRIPCAWDSHAPGGVITETWLDSVKTVVDYAIANQLYVVLNIHHEGEGGWFQTHIDENVDNTVDTKMKNYWTQIAKKFATYDEHLIFAGANEPGSNLGDKWTANHVATLMHYYQTFINAVRAVPGNETRTLIIQGLNTDIDKSVKSAPVTVFPKDTQEGYLMFEVHYYDPYQYTLMFDEQDWGAPNDEKIIPQFYYGAEFLGTDPKRNAGYNAWAGSVDQAYYTEKHVNTQFAKMKTNYGDKGYPVLVGEFGANIRTPDLDGADLEKHLKGRVQWHKDVAAAAKKYGLVPVLWDMGNESTDSYDNMAYIRRQSAPVGKIVDADAINAIREAFNMTAVIGGGTTPVIQPGDKALHLSYKTIQSDSSEAGTMRIDLGGKDWSQYVAISFDMRVAGVIAGPCMDKTRDGCDEYGWASVSLFNMSSSKWDWKEVSLGNVEDLGILDNYKIPFGATGMDITDPTDMKSIGINLYGTQFTGDMYLDNMLLWKADGTVDTLNNFNKKGATYAGTAKGTLIPANATGDWGTTTAIKPRVNVAKMSVTVQQGLVNATFHSPRATQASVMLVNSLGQEIAAKHFTAMPGANSVQFSTGYRGHAMLIVKQGGQKFIQKIILK